MKRRPLPAAAVLLALAAQPCPLSLGAEPLALPDLPGLVLAHDPSATAADQAALVAYHAYRSMLAEALPKVDLSTQYSLAYTPSMTVQVLPAPSPATELADQATHVVSAKATLSQILPTAGSLFVSVEDAMTASGVGSSTTGGSTTYPPADFGQRPKLSVTVTQPVLLNGRLIDLELFPASLRKAQIGYEKEATAQQAARNQAVLQAMRLYLSVVQLRRGVVQLEGSLQLGERRLGMLEQNVRLGTVTEADLLESRIGAGQQRETLLDLRASLARTERLLAHAIGRDSLEGLELADAVPDYARDGDAASLGELALRQYPVVVQRSLAVEERRADELLAGQRYASTFTLSMSVSPRYPFGAATRDLGQSFGDLFASGAGVDWTASAGLTIRLFDGGKQEEDRSSTRAVTLATEQALAGQRQAVLDELRASLERRSILRERVALLGETIGLAEQRLATEQDLLAVGRSTDLDVDARRLEAEAKRSDLWRARADLLLVNLDLASLAGDDLAKLVGGFGR